MIKRAKAGDELKVYYISLDHVGIDIHDTFTPKYTAPPNPKLTQSQVHVSIYKYIILYVWALFYTTILYNYITFLLVF